MTDQELDDVIAGKKKLSDISESTGNMILPLKDAIIKVAAERGVNPAYLQGLVQLETQSGKKNVGNYNAFNIKDFSGKGTGTAGFDKVEKSKSQYRDYNNYEEAINDFVDLAARKYPDALKATTPQEFANGLKGYATDPNHGSKLVAVLGGNKKQSNQTKFTGPISDDELDNIIKISTENYNKKRGNPSTNIQSGEKPDNSLSMFGEAPAGALESDNTPSSGKTFVKSFANSATAGLSVPLIGAVTEEEKKANPKASLAGDISGTVPYMLIPGGPVVNAGIQSLRAGSQKAFETKGDAGDKAEAAAKEAGYNLAGSAIGGGIGAVASKVAGKVVEYGRKALGKLYPSVTGGTIDAGEKAEKAALARGMSADEALAEKKKVMTESAMKDVQNMKEKEKAIMLGNPDTKTTIFNSAKRAFEQTKGQLLGGAAGAAAGYGAATLMGAGGTGQLAGAAAGALTLYKANFVKQLVKDFPDFGKKNAELIIKLKPETVGNKYDFKMLSFSNAREAKMKELGLLQNDGNVKEALAKLSDADKATVNNYAKTVSDHAGEYYDNFQQLIKDYSNKASNATQYTTQTAGRESAKSAEDRNNQYKNKIKLQGE